MTAPKYLIAVLFGIIAGVSGIVIAGVPGIWCVLIGEIIGWLSYAVGSA